MQFIHIESEVPVAYPPITMSLLQIQVAYRINLFWNAEL